MSLLACSTSALLSAACYLQSGFSRCVGSKSWPQSVQELVVDCPWSLLARWQSKVERRSMLGDANRTFCMQGNSSSAPMLISVADSDSAHRTRRAHVSPSRRIAMRCGWPRAWPPAPPLLQKDVHCPRDSLGLVLAMSSYSLDAPVGTCGAGHVP